MLLLVKKKDRNYNNVITTFIVCFDALLFVQMMLYSDKRWQYDSFGPSTQRFINFCTLLAPLY